jgi:hypothetical protein
VCHISFGKTTGKGGDYEETKGAQLLKLITREDRFADEIDKLRGGVDSSLRVLCKN